MTWHSGPRQVAASDGPREVRNNLIIRPSALKCARGEWTSVSAGRMLLKAGAYAMGLVESLNVGAAGNRGIRVLEKYVMMVNPLSVSTQSVDMES